MNESMDFNEISENTLTNKIYKSKLCFDKKSFIEIYNNWNVEKSYKYFK